MSEIVLGPFMAGIDHVSPDTQLPKGAVRDAVNGDFNRAGEFSRRHGYSLVLASSGLHSLWTSPATGYTYCGQGDALCSVRESSPGSLAVTAITSLGSMAPISFCDHDGQVLFANSGTCGRLLNDIASRLAPSAPTVHAVTATSAGGLDAGRYGICLTSMSAEGESETTAVQFVDVAQGGGIALTLAAGQDAKLLYRTAPNGDQLYLAATIPAALTAFTVGTGQLGRLVETQHLAPMPPGQIIRTWNGRIYVARGSSVYFSEPMRGLHSPRHGFIQFADHVTLLEPVDGGLFVGTAAGIVFLQGSRPGDMQLKQTGALAPFEGSGQTVPASVFGGDIGKSGQMAAIWLSSNGFVIGTASGQVVEAQSERIAIEPNGATTARTFVHDRRVTSIIQ